MEEREFMKKIFKIALVLLLALSIVACGKKDDGGDNTGGTDAPKECAVTIGLVTDTGGVDDKSFNQSAWEGVLRYAEENGFTAESKSADGVTCYSYLQSAAEADYVPNLSAMADNGVDLVMAVGYLFQEAIEEVAPKYPDTKFLFVDSVADIENVASAVYAAEQGSFLVGVAAALRAQAEGSDKVGFIGGMEGELIGAFQAGFEQGVWAVDPEMTVYVDYAASFSDDAIGQTLASKQYGAGATIIYQAAGAAGNGVIKEAKERATEGVWAIGVDKDQYSEGMLDDGTSIILTSMIKRVDESTYQVANQVKDGAFAGGVLSFTLTNNGVGAEISEGRNLTAEEIAAVLEYSEKIASGEIEVSPTPVIGNGQSGVKADFE